VDGLSRLQKPPSKFLLGAIIAHPSVSYVATVPGPRAGALVAFISETAIAAGMMLMVLFVINTWRVAI
jgi:hypothetical protein